ncbi:MAG TPA: DUF1707 domain-containing protein [Pseudonocardiaceae bacterium]|nr:DUF1707 domain-containing protein [Pseudonocardiaceae bacterium]
MSEQPNRPSHLDLRAADADRERVAQFLHTAMAEGRLTVGELDERLQAVYAAKTFADLVPITVDLPVNANQIAPNPAPASAPPVPHRIGGAPGSSSSIAIMSGFERRGDWVVPPTHTAIAVMGGGKLDLMDAGFAQAETTIYAFAFMGGIEVIVPDDITVRVEGFGFMGGFDDKASGEAGPGAPVLHVKGVAFMGGVEVKRPRKRRKDRRQIGR